MMLSTCIAYAIHKDLDIIEAMPEVQDIPVEELEGYVEKYVLNLQENLCRIIEGKCDMYIRAHDAAGMCATCLDGGIILPPRMLLRMCQTVIQFCEMDAKFIMDMPNGAGLYHIKMNLDFTNLLPQKPCQDSQELKDSENGERSTSSIIYAALASQSETYQKKSVGKSSESTSL